MDTTTTLVARLATVPRSLMLETFAHLDPEPDLALNLDQQNAASYETTQASPLDASRRQCEVEVDKV